MMTIAPRPNADDIVVREDRAAGRQIYVLHRYAGVDQVFVSSRSEAIARALSTAHQRGVAAWITENGNGPVALDGAPPSPDDSGASRD